LFEELLKRGWAEDELKDIAGRNLLRVLRKNEEVARQMSNTPPGEDWISEDDVKNYQCRTSG